MTSGGSRQRRGSIAAMAVALVAALFLASGAARLFVRCFSSAHGDAGTIEAVHARGSCACSCAHAGGPAAARSAAPAAYVEPGEALPPHDHDGCTDLALRFDCKSERGTGTGTGGDGGSEQGKDGASCGAPPPVFAARAQAPERSLACGVPERPPRPGPLLRAHDVLLLL